MFYDKLWAKWERFGVLLCPAGDGGQSVAVRAGCWFFRVEMDAWKDD